MIVILIQIVHAVILWLLELFLYPELLIYPYLTFNKLLPYKQILDQHFPGLMFFPINFYSLGFRDPESFKVLLVITILIQSAMIYKITKSKLSVFLFTLWQPLFEGNQLWLDTFLPLFTLPAYLLIQSGNWWLSGLLLGIGIVFKQTLIPLSVFVGLLLLFKRQIRPFWIFSAFSLAPSMLTLIYFHSLGALGDFWYWTITFNLTTFAAYGRNLPTLGELIKVLSITCLAGFLFMTRPKTRQALILALVSSLETLSRFGLIHLQPAIPFLAIASANLKNQTKAAFVVIVISIVWFGYFLGKQKNILGFKYFDPDTKKIIAIIKNFTHPKDKIFLLGVQPHIYQQSRTLPSGNLFVFQFPWFLQVSGERVLAGLNNDPPKLILYNPESEIDGQYLKDYGHYLVEYTQRFYRPLDQVGSTLIYARRN